MAIPRRCAVVQGGPLDGFGDELAAITANLPGDSALGARPGVSALGWLHKDVTRIFLACRPPLCLLFVDTPPFISGLGERGVPLDESGQEGGSQGDACDVPKLLNDSAAACQQGGTDSRTGGRGPGSDSQWWDGNSRR